MSEYRNAGHYLREGWSATPKPTFAEAVRRIEAARPPDGGTLLDVGCATGEFLHLVGTRFPRLRPTGVDIQVELLAEATRRLPEVEFRRASALELPREFDGSFDVVTAFGVLSIFDDLQLEIFWENLLRVARPGGLVLVLGPLNGYGVDCMIRHRKRVGGALGGWEGGWNIHSRVSIEELLARLGLEARITPFEPPLDLAPREDPVRTWTLETSRRERQLTNGLQLLIDLYFIEVEIPIDPTPRR